MTDTITGSELTLKIVKPFGDLRPGESFHFSVPTAGVRYWGTGLAVSDGEVIAVDQQQRPALIARRMGKGGTLLSAYPLESYLANEPAAFDNHDTVYRLYKALRAWGAVRPLVSSDQPSVEATALQSAAGGYIVLANHSGERLRTGLRSSLPIRSLRQLTGTGSAPILADAAVWTVELPAYSGAILEWQP